MLLCAAYPLRAVAGPAGAGDTPLRDARQLVLVTTDDWNSSGGTLETFELTARGWQPASKPAPVNIGRAGAAWGVGLHSPQLGPAKQEGDGRAPAGVFQVGDAFGYADTAITDLRYLAMGATHYCVDVAASPLYNRIVDTRVVGDAAIAGSTEPMRRDLHVDGDQLYRLGFVIEHNPGNIPGAGSCIFAHLWRAPGASTAGCTAMAEPVMRELLAWLQPEQRPVFVLLPRAEYRRLRRAWQLPRSGVSAGR